MMSFFEANRSLRGDIGLRVTLEERPVAADAWMGSLVEVENRRIPVQSGTGQERDWLGGEIPVCCRRQ